jgi:hypothetical protein
MNKKGLGKILLLIGLIVSILSVLIILFVEGSELSIGKFFSLIEVLTLYLPLLIGVVLIVVGIYFYKK